MSVNASGGSPVVHPQQYQTLPTSLLSQAEQQDRSLRRSELDELLSFFRSGVKLLQIVETLTENADQIVSAGAKRIFWGGNPMDYLDKPIEKIDLPGFGRPVTLAEAALAKEAVLDREFKKLQVPSSINPPRNFNPFSHLWENLQGAIQGMLAGDREALPGGFKAINISRYGTVRMKRSMRDLAWFLRYITYAIVAGDGSILTVNARGLRGVIPEDVTMATVVALKEMRWKSLTYFKGDEEASEIIKHYFDVLIDAYQVEKPPVRLRQGVSNDQQGLQLPESYSLSAEVRSKFFIQPGFLATEKQAAIKAAYRQVFECDINRAYGLSLSDLESKVNSGNLSMKEFIRALGKSRLYRRQFYEPYAISRVIELAFRHFLGRGLSSLEEFQEHFEIMSKGGLPALVDALVDSEEYADYFGEETVPYLRGLGQEAQECRNWGPQFDLFKHSAPVRKVPQFVTLFANYQKPLSNQHVYGTGNDPLEIQFGAIFPEETRNLAAQPSPYGKDNRRILIGCGLGNGNGHKNGSPLGRAPSLSSKVLKLNGAANGNGNRGANINLAIHCAETAIRGAYRQVFGRDVYSGQRLVSAETKLKGGEITMREFVRQLAKSRLFRSLYWDSFYITKAIEYIHRRLLGRPTYGRAEMSRYYDLCAKKGFYALIDEIIDSLEYSEAFGEDTVPYERYVTPRGFAMRSLREPAHWSSSQLNRTVSAGMFLAQKMQEKNKTRITAANRNASQTQAQQTTLLVTVREETHEYSQTSDS
ncbi:photosystem I reaction center subunit XI [Hydrococcus rivularis NIES-593]|uniref:Phycobiliprotein ApcE n=1 Tax=Hydrococcus rivularis NIES-593 TaxID=1921803 RepID=A0A1U7HE77_9CYAN|nr:phycobilisome rod-core linker polypeptide [Hydrococcus rivularis]OKH21845.1 photosystem I reaction center subunit XI [Hydrococcus rivularis NIES-593]